MSFTSGRLVQLKSGGPTMTVDFEHKHDGKIKQGNFEPSSLMEPTPKPELSADTD